MNNNKKKLLTFYNVLPPHPPLFIRVSILGYEDGNYSLIMIIFVLFIFYIFYFSFDSFIYIFFKPICFYSIWLNFLEVQRLPLYITLIMLRLGQHSQYEVKVLNTWHLKTGMNKKVLSFKLLYYSLVIMCFFLMCFTNKLALI